MARKNNPRNLRSSVWANPTFCSFCANKQRVFSWTKSLQGVNNTFAFINKVMLKNKNFKNPKKNSSSSI